VLAAGLAAYVLLLFFTLRNRLAKYAALLVGAAAVVLMIGGPFKLDPKFWGVVLMGVSVLIFVALPWLDQSPARSMRYRPGWHFWLLMAFVVVFLVLGYFGTQPPSPVNERASQAGTLAYFGFFLLMPWWSRMGEFKPAPKRVTFAAH
jgi:ubiquinol-cytochrome c reductase cytochrome b subunit